MNEKNAARLKRMLDAIQEQSQKANQTRYVPPQVKGRAGVRLKQSLRWLRPAEVKRRLSGSVISRDYGRLPGMSGRQWKRLKKAEHFLATATFITAANGGFERVKRVNRAHELADRRAQPQPGAKFRDTGTPAWRRNRRIGSTNATTWPRKESAP